MESVKELIRHNAKYYPDFAYYIPLVEKAQKNRQVHPDICFETCKSLLEGVSKSIAFRIDSSLDRERIDKWKVDKLLKKAFVLLHGNENDLEENFILQCGKLVEAMRLLRNERGDISHGQGVPKLQQSDVLLATLGLNITAAILGFLLESFFDLEHVRLRELADKPVEYESNLSFNAYLDEENPLPDRILYSRALYEQYYEDYLIQLGDYQYEQEIAESGDNE